MKAAIDIGSNSLRLLVTDGNKVVRQDVCETKLGEGFREGELTSASISRTLDVLDRWKQETVTAGIPKVTVFATSAVRDANNRDEFVSLVRNRTGEDLRILSGEEEAWYSFSGAVGGFDFPKENCLLIDIGGGSTELAGFENGKLKGISMPFGAVRWKVMAYRRSEVKQKMSAQATLCHFDNVKYHIGVGGTITTAGAVLGEISEYSRSAIHGKTIDYTALEKLKCRLSALSLDERKQVTGLPEARADIILYGLEILEILFEILNIPQLYISDWGILDGILAE